MKPQQTTIEFCGWTRVDNVGHGLRGSHGRQALMWQDLICAS